MNGSTASAYAKELGVRLRAIRTAQGLSLHGVEEKSRGQWKAVVVGSYERGDRAPTVEKLAQLADFYDVAASDLLPGGHVVMTWGAGRRAAAAREAAEAFLEQIPTVVGALPAKEFGYIAERVAGAIKQRLEEDISAHYERTIAQLEAQLEMARLERAS